MNKPWTTYPNRYIDYYEQWLQRADDEIHRRMILAKYRFAANPKNDGKMYDSWQAGINICGSEEALIQYLEAA